MANTAKVLIIFVLVALVFVGYFVFGYRVKQTEIDQADRQIADLQSQLNEVKAVAQVLQPIEHEIETLDQQLKQSLALLPEEKQLEALVRNFEELGSTSGLDLTRIVPGAEIGRDFYAEIPVELEIRGSYHNIAIFFDKISKLKRLVNIANLKIGTPTEVSGEMVVTANCTATTFRFRKASETPPAPAAPPPEKKAEKAAEKKDEAGDTKAEKGKKK